jgi:hypothetical protein
VSRSTSSTAASSEHVVTAPLKSDGRNRATR